MQVSTFGNRLSILLEENHMTYAELARIIHVAKPTIKKYVNDEINPRPDKVKAIAEYFHVDKSWLYGNNVDRKGNSKSKYDYLMDDDDVRAIAKAIGNTSEYVRVRSKLTQQQVAEALGHTVDVIIEFENGLDIPPSCYPFRLCKLCNFPINEFYELFLFNYDKMKRGN